MARVQQGHGVNPKHAYKAHKHSVPISPSKYAKSRLLNRDSHFWKDYQYAFFLLWQKDMCELSADIYSLMKSTRQYVMPIREFIDKVSDSDQEIEANLSTVFQSV